MTGQTQGALSRYGLTGFDTRHYEVDKANDMLKDLDRRRGLSGISWLIATMATRGATDVELGRAIRYSMVVLDAEKLNLNWKQAKADEGIDILVEKYV